MLFFHFHCMYGIMSLFVILALAYSITMRIDGKHIKFSSTSAKHWAQRRWNKNDIFHVALPIQPKMCFARFVQLHHKTLQQQTLATRTFPAKKHIKVIFAYVAHTHWLGWLQIYTIKKKAECNCWSWLNIRYLFLLCIGVLQMTITWRCNVV